MAMTPEGGAVKLHDDPLCTLYLGDCVEVMAELPADSIDAIVTDPPYGIGFMGHEWDNPGFSGKQNGKVTEYGRGHHKPGPSASMVAGEYDQSRAGHVTFQDWCTTWAHEAFRVAKPGAHLLAFGGTRTYHRLASAIEDAGWEIRDCLVWAYASGFPKSLDVSKAIDKAAGAEREVVGPSTRRPSGVTTGAAHGQYLQGATPLTAPATPDAEKWNGWGTALKPAWEPIVMARKPLRGTVAANVLAHGTGALNIDATRIGTGGPTYIQPRPTSDGNGSSWQKGDHVPFHYGENGGRWPANLLLTDPIFDGDTPGVVGGGSATSAGIYERQVFGERNGPASIPLEGGAQYGDSGTYSRFFLIPKSSRSDREPVLRGQLAPLLGKIGNHGNLSAGDDLSKKLGTNVPRANSHPTVKPLDLMRHLVRLVTPPGGTVLDCFLGSGTTAIAANAEGFRCIGIEKEREYLDIALARMLHEPLGMAL